MVFSSLFFLFYFLPFTLLFYYLTPERFRNTVLFVISLIFYSWGEPKYISIMIISTLSDYIHGILIDKSSSPLMRKSLLISSIVINLSLLSIFKYSDFLITNINYYLKTNLPLLHLPLPIGISFYTFQTMSYTIDVYLRTTPAQRNFIDFGAYVTLFPQLIAGPIVQYKTIAEQLTNRKENIAQTAEGIKRFIIGLGKKVLLANNIGLLSDEIHLLPTSDLSILTTWLGIIAFGFQIYFDFSGYSDMAIGLGKMLGFDFLENFNYPYISQNISEFWRRWHISLGTWFRDYVYIPLGGNRVSFIKLLRNIFITWFLTGFWHGASWNYIYWGLYFGLIIALEKWFLLSYIKRLPLVFRHIYALVLISFGWVLFSFENLKSGLEYATIMLGIKGYPLWNQRFLYYLSNYKFILLILALSSTPIIKNRLDSLKKLAPQSEFVFLQIGLVLIFIFSIAYLVDSTYNPFLYFRF